MGMTSIYLNRETELILEELKKKPSFNLSKLVADAIEKEKDKEDDFENVDKELDDIMEKEIEINKKKLELLTKKKYADQKKNEDREKEKISHESQLKQQERIMQDKINNCLYFLKEDFCITGEKAELLATEYVNDYFSMTVHEFLAEKGYRLPDPPKKEIPDDKKVFKIIEDDN